VAAILVLATFAATACATKLGGTPVAATTVPDELPSSTSEGLLGDLTTVDPCGYVEPELFEQFGRADWGITESLDYCVIDVSTDDSEVYLTIGHLDDQFVEEDLEDQRVRDIDDKLWIGQPADEADYCSLMLVFTDEITLRVDGQVTEGTVEICDLVEVGMDGVVEAIKADKVAHREPPADSLQPIDPCDLLSDASVFAQPGLADAARYDYPAKHECIWVTDGAPTVRLLFATGPTPVPYGEGSTSSDIAGRPSVVYPVSDSEESSYCIVDTAHVPFTGPGQDEDVVEIASVWVDQEAGQVEAACAAATALAAEVWPKLPGV
jgi:hypothetical protein